jgi:hypothetical protein
MLTHPTCLRVASPTRCVEGSLRVAYPVIRRAVPALPLVLDLLRVASPTRWLASPTRVPYHVTSRKRLPSVTADELRGAAPASSGVWALRGRLRLTVDAAPASSHHGGFAGCLVSSGCVVLASSSSWSRPGRGPSGLCCGGSWRWDGLRCCSSIDRYGHVKPRRKGVGWCVHHLHHPREGLVSYLPEIYVLEWPSLWEHRCAPSVLAISVTSV